MPLYRRWRSCASSRAAAPRAFRRGSSSSSPTSASASARGSPGGTSMPAARVMTSLYPEMSEATTGVAQANARVSTIPKLSPPSDGAASAFAERSSAVNASWSRKPSTSIPSSETRSRVSSNRTASGSAPIRRSRAPVRARMSSHARSRIWRPFRGSCRPANTIRCSRPLGSASVGMSTPFGTTS